MAMTLTPAQQCRLSVALSFMVSDLMRATAIDAPSAPKPAPRTLEGVRLEQRMLAQHLKVAEQWLRDAKHTKEH